MSLSVLLDLSVAFYTVSYGFLPDRLSKLGVGEWRWLAGVPLLPPWQIPEGSAGGWGVLFDS